jgi:hypothetical protein
MVVRYRFVIIFRTDKSFKTSGFTNIKRLTDINVHIYIMLNKAQSIFCLESKKTKSNVPGQWKNTITFQKLMNIDVNPQPDARHTYYVQGSRSSNTSNGSRK